MSIGYIVIMIRFIILFITRVKRFSCCFLRIVRVYPIDTTNSPLHERETAQPSIRPGTRSRTAWAQLSPLRARSHTAEYSPWDAQPYHLGAAITATSTQPHNRVFTLGRAAMQPSIRPGTRNRTAWAQPIHPRRSAKINPARLLRAGYPAMK